MFLISESFAMLKDQFDLIKEGLSPKSFPLNSQCRCGILISIFIGEIANDCSYYLKCRDKEKVSFKCQLHLLFGCGNLANSEDYYPFESKGERDIKIEICISIYRIYARTLSFMLSTKKRNEVCSFYIK